MPPSSRGNSVTTPSVLIRPICCVVVSTNQSAPSGPTLIPPACAAKVGILCSIITGEVVCSGADFQVVPTSKLHGSPVLVSHLTPTKTPSSSLGSKYSVAVPSTGPQLGHSWNFAAMRPLIIATGPRTPGSVGLLGNKIVKQFPCVFSS